MALTFKRVWKKWGIQMKKNGRKGRRLQKEKAERKAAARAKIKVGEPFSKAKTRKKLCLHYKGTPGGFTPGFCYSLLFPIGETECICAKLKFEEYSRFLSVFLRKFYCFFQNP